MLRLVLKIFLAYWMAAGVVIFISDFEPHRQIHHPELTDALDSALAMNGRLLVHAYEDGDCSEVEQILSTKNDSLGIASADGRFLCGDPGVFGEQSLVLAAAKSKKRMTTNNAMFQVIATPMQVGDETYILVLKAGYSSALQVYGLLPGYTTIAISCVVTLFLSFLVALPIRKLRKAAQEIARGTLESRVYWGKVSEHLYGFRGRDDIAKLVQDFNHMAERLQSLADAQRMLLRDVSHELRSPLARLAVGLGLARQEATPTMRVHLDRIESESKRLNDLIGQILSLSHLETLEKVEMTTAVSLDDLVMDLLPDVQYEASQCGCSITAEFATECVVRGDTGLLRSAIENIVRNAIRYVPGTGEIRVETLRIAGDGKRWCAVRISDNGPGIPEAELKSVLEPFYRADRSRHWQKAGFGIGLAIAKRAANVHGGKIEIWNRKEGGLVVEMRYPLLADAA